MAMKGGSGCMIGFSVFQHQEQIFQRVMRSIGCIRSELSPPLVGVYWMLSACNAIALNEIDASVKTQNQGLIKYRIAQA
jgi:hypothetical protein